MAKNRKKAKASPRAPRAPRKPRLPWEWITIASFCIVIGLFMTFARSGRVVPLPADHRGPAPTVAAMDAGEMRVYGLFTLFMGLGMAGLAWHQWKNPPAVDKESGT